MTPQFNRRGFLGAGAAGLGYFYTATARSATRTAQKPNETLRFAGIGADHEALDALVPDVLPELPFGAEHDDPGSAEHPPGRSYW